MDASPSPTGRLRATGTRAAGAGTLFGFGTPGGLTMIGAQFGPGLCRTLAVTLTPPSAGPAHSSRSAAKPTPAMAVTVRWITPPSYRVSSKNSGA